MRVLRNDPIDTMSSTAKKVMTSFKAKQTQWEANIPFGKKNETKTTTKKFSTDSITNTLSAIRSNMGPKSREHESQSVAQAKIIMPKLDKSELKDLPMASAKPSEIAKAAKAKRKATMAETKAARERQQKVAEQQMKMNRYRDEIAMIKKKQEQENKQSKNPNSKTNNGRGKKAIADDVVQKVLTKEVTAKDENAVLGYSENDFNSDDEAFGNDDEDGGAKITPFSPKSKTENRRRQSVLTEMKSSMQDALDQSRRTEEAVASKDDDKKDKKVASSDKKKGRIRSSQRRGSVGGEKKRAGGRPASSSNLVPEMRRKPNQADLLLDKSVHAANPTELVSDGKNSNYHGTQFHKKQLINEKQQKEKQDLEHQKQKLEEAEEAFKKGHNLCWQIQDSAAALQEYRTALFIRESMLGKHHEQTGRTYFWIGKSLVKLGEYSEALVAFSRSLRIFDTVVRKQHKYYKWTVTAIDECLEQMDDPYYKTYKARLYKSIQFEREGDTYRKQGKMDMAIAKYRDAIDHVEDYHPDAADLYSKIALILRQDGDFERAQEEYRFACEIYEMSLGADHPETIKALNEVMEKKRLGQLSNMLKNKLKLKV